MIDDQGIACDIALWWMPVDLADDKSTLVQVMACCHQATSHYPRQCWPSFMLPYGITRPQWVKKRKMLIYKWACIITCMWLFILQHSLVLDIGEDRHQGNQDEVRLFRWLWQDCGNSRALAIESCIKTSILMSYCKTMIFFLLILKIVKKKQKIVQVICILYHPLIV